MSVRPIQSYRFLKEQRTIPPLLGERAGARADVINKPGQRPSVSFCINTSPNFWKYFSFVRFVFADGYFDFDFLATNAKHSLAVQFLAARIDDDFVNPKFIRTISDNFDKFVCCHTNFFAMCSSKIGELFQVVAAINNACVEEGR